MDIFTPASADDFLRGAGTQNERNAWFYARINALATGVSNLDTTIKNLQQQVGTDESTLNQAVSDIATLKKSVQSLINSFSDLSASNGAYQTQLTGAFQTLTDLVNNYNGQVSKLSAQLVNDETRITNLEAVVNPDQMKAIIAKVNGLDDQIKAEVASEVGTAVASAKSDILNTVQTQISTQNDNISAINKVASAANSNAVIAMQNVSNVSADLASLTTKETDDVSALTSQITAETTRATNAESTLATAINAETNRATTAENANATAISTEAKTRLNSDNQLQTNIDNECSARCAADNTLQNNIDNNTKLINAETKRATNAEGTLESEIDAEVCRATKAEQNEQARAEAAEANNSNAIITEQNRAQTAETKLTIAVNAEVQRASEAEETLTTNLNAEITRAKGQEGQLQLNIDAMSKADKAYTDDAFSHASDMIGKANDTATQALDTANTANQTAQKSWSTINSTILPEQKDHETRIAQCEANDVKLFAEHGTNIAENFTLTMNTGNKLFSIARQTAPTQNVLTINAPYNSFVMGQSKQISGSGTFDMFYTSNNVNYYLTVWYSLPSSNDHCDFHIQGVMPQNWTLNN